MVKPIEKNIKEAFAKLGFNEEEVRAGCWLLERGTKQVAWIATHKFLEKVATSAGISFKAPIIIEGDAGKSVALVVTGVLGDKEEWSIGEAALGLNYHKKGEKMDVYPYAMAEKRGKDRVILKFLGLHGDMYSEEEADDFKKQVEKPARGVVTAQRKEYTERLECLGRCNSKELWNKVKDNESVWTHHAYNTYGTEYGEQMENKFAELKTKYGS